MATGILLAALLALSVDQAPERVTPNTLKLADDVPSPAATLRDMAWLSGRWTGPASAA
jgi:hypothetical protein